MAMSLASAPQTVTRLRGGGKGGALVVESAPQRSAFSWSRRVSTSLKVSQQWNAGRCSRIGRLECMAQDYKVEITHEGKKHVLHVPEGESILSVAIEAGIEVPYDCQLGVCMTCPAKLEKGVVDQDQGMLSDDVKEKGYTLMCVAYPQSDCSIRSIQEEELLSLQLATADD